MFDWQGSSDGKYEKYGTDVWDHKAEATITGCLSALSI
jgi:hypothetical protein